ncbi:MAG: hypothetical protein OSA98_12985 [Rubripirellula sp.]|nr:hypothetical protein [Rubripirellula sp.]
MRHHSPRWGSLIIAIVICTGLSQPHTAIGAEESATPGAPHLLPKDTLAYIRIDSADNFRSDMESSSIGQMMNDPKLRPFVGELYSTMSQLFEQFGTQLGLSLDELLAIPTGQVAAAAMPANLSDRDEELAEEETDSDSPEAIRRRIERKRRQQNAIAGIFILEAGKNLDNMMSLIDRLEERMIQGGYVRRTSKADGTTIVKLLPPRQGPPEVEYFTKDDTLVFGIGHETAAKALDQWTGKSEEDSLADRADFTSLMSRCIGAEETRPQITFFLDPYHFVERLVNRGGAAALVWPLVENLGISKIRGMGGSSYQGGDVFEDIAHFHILLDPPRDGMFGVLRPETGDTTPPKWVPSNVSSYTTLNWDFDQTYENVDKLLATFQGAEPLKRFIEDPAKQAAGVSIKDDVLSNLTGRIVTCAWMEPPVRLNSRTSAFALEIKDELNAKSLIAKFRDRRPNDLEVETIGGVVVYSLKNRSQRELPENFRVARPGFMIMGKWFIFSDSQDFLTQITRANADSMPRLINEPEYELVSSELGGKLDGETPFLVSFLRGADSIRQIYDLAKSPDTQRLIRSAGQQNPFMARIVALLEQNELPDFKEFEKYFAPTGTFAYDEPAGMHFGFFTLKADN